MGNEKTKSLRVRLLDLWRYVSNADTIASLWEYPFVQTAWAYLKQHVLHVVTAIGFAVWAALKNWDPIYIALVAVGTFWALAVGFDKIDAARHRRRVQVPVDESTIERAIRRGIEGVPLRESLVAARLDAQQVSESLKSDGTAPRLYSAKQRLFIGDTLAEIGPIANGRWMEPSNEKAWLHSSKATVADFHEKLPKLRQHLHDLHIELNNIGMTISMHSSLWGSTFEPSVRRQT